ncbi:MAG: M23 family metallopeptidase, partial [Patescibacteria group bacterium]
ATLSNGATVRKKLEVGKRVVVEAPLGIPEELGGNTPEAEQELLNTLVQEGAIINAIPTSPAKLWQGAFRLPIDSPITITDTYGYGRLTGASTIAHKGTDFRAAVGTPVYVMNSGLIRYVGSLRNYGHVVAVDHGLGLLSIYMHLSEVLVSEGVSVEKGTLIAKSGATGYVLGPHLHLTLRINNISIDPMKFVALLGEK